MKMKIFLLLLITFVFCSLTTISFSPINCWDFTSESTCTSNDCHWKSDPFGYSWCEELDCWSFWTQSECEDANSTYDLSCSWEEGSMMGGWCESFGCWSFEGTNESTCVNGSLAFGLTCEWSGTEGEHNCMGPWEKNCHEHTTRDNCINSSGCIWGSCYETGCWNYDNDQDACNAAPNCAWDSSGPDCDEATCWSSKYNVNQESCENESDTMLCKWTTDYGGYCEDLTCHSYDNNQTGCTDPSINGGLNCEWEAETSKCMEQGCWSYWTENDCRGKIAGGKNCTWQTSKMSNSGWCEKIACWKFDNISVVMSGGVSTNESYCINNTYSLSCEYNDGWCYQDIGSLSCANLSDQKKCWDTMWCFWDDVGNTCIDPGDHGISGGGAIGGGGGGGAFKAPPCGVFYLNETNCNQTIGCHYNSTLNGTARCAINASYYNSISQNGLNCTLFTDSTLCNSVPFMPRCCEWQAGSCVENKFSTSCWDDLATPPDGANYCEDTNSYNSEIKCNQIANYPWYMPCQWNNQTGKKRCEFAFDFFGQDLHDDEKGDLDMIDNKLACEKGGGGTWVTESYCGSGNVSNISITVGRCVAKLGVAGGNCNLNCRDCEFTSTGSNHSTTEVARETCEESDLGFCEWTTDTNAPNKFGFCKPKKEFQSGAVSKCTSTNCDACNMYQSGKAQDKCTDAGCEWAVDPLDPTTGICIGKGEKTCIDDCAPCNSEQACVTMGRGGPNSTESGTSPCTWDDSYGICKGASSGSNSNSEICFNAVDDDGDGNTDCADNGCFSDPFCGGNEMIDCFQYNNFDTCNGTTGCWWFNDSFGSWCGMKTELCWQNDGDQSACNGLAGTCEWHTPPPGMESMCDISETVMDQCNMLNSTNCTTHVNCTWYIDDWCASNPGSCGDDPGWCGHKYEVCWMNMTLNSDPTECNAHPNCTWMFDPFSPTGGFCEPPCFNLGNDCANDNLCEGVSGFCDPIGFGGGGGEMFNCWEYDDDQVQCDNQTQCSWMVEPMPFCDTMMGFDCAQFGSNKDQCNANGNCSWLNQSELMGMPDVSMPSWCGMKFEQCFMNQSYEYNNAGNISACNANPNCNWTSMWNSCEPSMFVSGGNDQDSCEATNGLWRTGWCEPAGMIGAFKGMAMDSPPVPLGMDADCNEQSLPGYSDICDVGLKESPDNWGLGIGVRDIRDAAMCNGVQTFQGQGTGEGTSKFYWYIDSDGTETGSCNLHSDDSSEGWDLYFTYVASYSDGSLSETRSAYRCINSQWTITNIQLNSWKEKMCNMLRGGMVAVNKDDLTQIEGLVDFTSNIRFFMATANGSTNSTEPLDVIGPVYYTPGTIDFIPECCWALGDPNIDCDVDGLAPINDPDCSFMTSDGYIKFEDCWGDGVDDDGDTYVDCDDPDCTGNTYCQDNNLGVHAPGYEDTTTPKILFWQIERYPDSAMLSFDSDEPTNGTLFFYKNNSGCTSDNLNATLYDIGIWNNATPKYKNWHEVELYNDAGVTSLDYALSTNTTYYFKFKVCDEAGHCSQSGCTNLTTAPSMAKCKKCNFIFNMELPSTVTLDLDLNNSGSYDSLLHRQCGVSAGFLINYTQARSVNMKFTDNSTTPSTEIYLLGARLTRSIMHNQEIRDIDKSGGIKAGTTGTTAGTTVGYAGLDKEITNKLVDKLHPKSCMIKIPGTGTCDSLYHCNDDLGNCVSKANVAGYSVNETGDNYCVWKIPCVFSALVGGQPGSTSDGGDTGGGGGGGGGSSGGGGGGFVSDAPTYSRYYQSIAKGAVIITNIDKPEIAITKNTFSLNKDFEGVTITVRKIEDDSVIPSGLSNVYQNLEIVLDKVQGSELRSASIEFKVSKYWISNGNYDKDSVSLQRYNNGWTKLNTKFLSEDSTYYYFSANTPGFSYFAITATPIETTEEPVTEEPETAPPESDEEQPEPGTPPEPKKSNQFLINVIIGLILISIVVLGYFIYSKHKK